MENTLNFLIEISKLKKVPRTGWVWLKVKNPETIAQHLFRVSIMNWFLAQGKRPKLNLKRIIQISLAHDLCEVYAGDMTPYWDLLPEDANKRKETLKRWIRLPKKIKEQRDRKKFAKEKKALQKLVKNLAPRLKKEITDSWLEYEKMFTKEGRFVKQGDKIETLLQALEYWGPAPDSPVLGWWEEIHDLVDDPILLGFLKKIEEKFYGKTIFFNHKKLSWEVEILLKIGKLKTMPKNGWVLRGVINPETIAEHSFLSAIANWVLSQGRKLSIEKVLKMSLVYKICEVYAGDATPYFGLLSSDCQKDNEILKRWPRFSKKEKERRFFRDYRVEKKALERLTTKLPKALKEEIISLWDECKRRLTPEGNFVSQVHWLTSYLQALQYFERDHKFPILAWAEQAKEILNDPKLLELRDEMEERFLAKVNF